MYVRAWEVRTYVHACVRTCVVRTYAEVGHAVLPVLAAPCVPVVDASTCVPEVPVVPVPGVPDRTIRTYVRTSQIHPRPPCHTPPMQFHYVRTYVSARVPLHDCGAGFARTCARTYARALFKSRDFLAMYVRTYVRTYVLNNRALS